MKQTALLTNPFGHQQQQPQPQEPSSVKSYLDMIKHDMEHEDLLKSFKAITQQMQQKKQQAPKANGTRSVVAPSPSSAPTGSKWTLDALAENIKAALHINPINTGAIKDIISLPFKDQFILLGAITERYRMGNRRYQAWHLMQVAL